MAIRSALVVSGLLLAFSTQNASAQFNFKLPGSQLGSIHQLTKRNTVSPYLNLINLGGGTPGQAAANFSLPNYQTLVKPQVQNRRLAQLRNRQLNNLQGQVQTLRTDIQRNQEEGAFSTGHPTRFMTYLHYYPQFGP